jgi:hypothetical protein
VVGWGTGLGHLLLRCAACCWVVSNEKKEPFFVYSIVVASTSARSYLTSSLLQMWLLEMRSRLLYLCNELRNAVFHFQTLPFRLVYVGRIQVCTILASTCSFMPYPILYACILDFRSP